MVSFQGARLDRETEPRVSDGTRINADPGIRRPHKTPVYPPAGQHTRTHALVLQPHPSCPCRRFGQGPELLAGPCSVLSALCIAALHARAFNSTQGQHGKIWGRKADGPCDEGPRCVVNDRLMLRFGAFVSQNAMKWRI